MVENVNTVTEAVRGAVLATQALELLGCKTPTVSVGALSLKHEFEVIAQCQFVGVEYHLLMEDRLEDIQTNLNAMSVWLRKERRRSFCLNSEAKILIRLIRVLDKYDEFEESQYYRACLRRIHRQISEIHEWKKLKLWRIALWPVVRYTTWVLDSLPRFVGTISLFLIVWTLLFWQIGGEKDFASGFHATIQSLFTVALPDKKDGWQALLLGYFAAAFGMLNFGLFVAHIYERLARRT